MSDFAIPLAVMFIGLCPGAVWAFRRTRGLRSDERRRLRAFARTAKFVRLVTAISLGTALMAGGVHFLFISSTATAVFVAVVAGLTVVAFLWLIVFVATAETRSPEP